jgi:tight adherence protein B
MVLTLILFTIFFTVALTGAVVIPVVYDRGSAESLKRQQKLSNTMEQLMPRSEAQRLGRLFVLAPVALGALGFFVFPEAFRLFGALALAGLGFLLPGIWVRMLKRRTREKFDDQLVDGLMIMSSSFRGGLSLIQAMEAVVEEMPDPIAKGFAMVLGENKMGVSLDDALNHLYNRVPSRAMQQMITSVLLARETGGNLPVIFTRIVTNIRENKKIQQNIDTLTIQGKIQGVVMSLLPVAFFFIIYSANKKLVEHMFYSQLGRGLLIYALVSWLIGAGLIWKISTFKDF